MPPALRLRPRASCLTWRRVEAHGLLQPSRQASNGQRWARKVSAVEPNEHSSKRQAGAQQSSNTTLLDELFPEEGQRAAAPVPAERQVPRLNLDLAEFPDVLTPSLPPTRRSRHQAPELPLDRAAHWPRFSDSQKQYAHLEKQGDFTSVLVLYNAGKDLVEEDFRRVIPQGKHLEGWTLDRGDILKVIPGRDTTTLERQNFYYLLFRSPTSAFAYQIHVTRLHKLSQIHRPRSLSSPIPPPPGYLMQGEDIAGMIQSYSLLPPSQDIRIRRLAPPHTPSMKQIIKYRGYPPIVKRFGRSPVEVIMRFEGPQLPILGIKSALNKAARERGLVWTGEEPHHLNILKWEVRGRHVDPMGMRRFREVEKVEGQTASAVEDEDISVEDEEEQEPTTFFRQRRHPSPSYIVGFQNEAEAETFVRYWHRRPLELANHDYDGDVPPIVNAELLW